MAMIIGAELSFVAGIGGMILQLALLFIVFSLPGRLKEQREYMDKRLDAIEIKLDLLLAEEKSVDGSAGRKITSETMQTND